MYFLIPRYLVNQQIAYLVKFCVSIEVTAFLKQNSTLCSEPQLSSLGEGASLSASLSSCEALSFSWVPGHAGLSSNDLADSLAKTGATLLFAEVPNSPSHCKAKHTRFSTYSLFCYSHNSLFYQIASVSSEELSFTYLARCEQFRLRCHDDSLLFSSYLCRIKRNNLLAAPVVITCRI